MTYRAIVANIIGPFRPEELQVLAALFNMAADKRFEPVADASVEVAQREKTLRQLHHLQHKVLDSYFDGPLVYIHLGASQRTILEAVTTLVQRWKTKQALPERRVHTGKLASERDIWDMREGWHVGRYYTHSERTLKSIAKARRLPKSTVINKYRAAFKWITGHEFATASWVLFVRCVEAVRFSTDHANSPTPAKSTERT